MSEIEEAKNEMTDLQTRVLGVFDRSRILSIKHLIAYNLLMGVVFTMFRYVMQKHYGWFDMGRVDGKLGELWHHDVCLVESSLVSEQESEKFRKLLLRLNEHPNRSFPASRAEENGIKLHRSNFPEGCFTIHLDVDREQLSSADLEIIDSNSIKLSFRNQRSIDKDLQKVIVQVANRLGRAPFGVKHYSPDLITFNSFQTVQLILFTSAETAASPEARAYNAQFKADITARLQAVLCDKMKVMEPADILVSERVVSKHSSIAADLDLASTFLINSTSLFEYFGDQHVLAQYLPEDP